MSHTKRTVITDKHCLQNVLILAVWDDVIPVFDHSPRAIFQIYLHHKTVWWKTHLLCSDYRLLQPNEQTFVLSTSPEWTTSSWLWSLFVFHLVLFFHVKKSSSCVSLIKCEMLSRRPTGDRLCLSVLTRTFISIYESGWRLLLLVSQFGLFLHPFVPSSSTSHSLGQNAKKAHLHLVTHNVGTIKL